MKDFIKFSNNKAIKKILTLVLAALVISALVLLFYFNILSLYFIFLIALIIGIFYQTNRVMNQKALASTLLNDSNKVKAAFLSNMSHEIRTPLNAINGYSEILAHTTNADEKKFLIENIRRNSYELTGFIDNIMEISKIEFGRIHISRSNVTLISIIEKISEPMQARAQAKGLSFAIESLGKLPPDIFVDQARVIQILINLIGNAIKFTEKGLVKVQIEADGSTGNESQLIFTIVDTGIGISISNQMELFQSFTQLDDSNTRRHGGIGLGLALSRRLAQQLDGDVVLLQSELGQGSSFSLRIPCGNLHTTTWKENLFDHLLKPPVQLNLPIEIGLQKKKVMLVEDSEDNQKIFKFFLKSAGALVEIAENGEIAVQKVKHTDYDFILMDIQLPKMDGHEATQLIRSMGYCKPIIALTAHASAEAKIKCLQSGCTDLITKPVSQGDLIQNILAIIQKDKQTGSTSEQK